jgi:hypothetical protein
LGVAQEFQEIDAMSEADALALALLSVRPRPAAEWLRLIDQLDELAASYCAACKLPAEAQARIAAARSRQSLASIPATIDWFLAQLGGAGHDQRPEDHPQGENDGQ